VAWPRHAIRSGNATDPVGNPAHPSPWPGSLPSMGA
jgi:hypothetical protein